MSEETKVARVLRMAHSDLACAFPSLTSDRRRLTQGALDEYTKLESALARAVEERDEARAEIPKWQERARLDNETLQETYDLGQAEQRTLKGDLARVTAERDEAVKLIRPWATSFSWTGYDKHQAGVFIRGVDHQLEEVAPGANATPPTPLDPPNSHE